MQRCAAFISTASSCCVQGPQPAARQSPTHKLAGGRLRLSGDEPRKDAAHGACGKAEDLGRARLLPEARVRQDLVKCPQDVNLSTRLMMSGTWCEGPAPGL